MKKFISCGMIALGLLGGNSLQSALQTSDELNGDLLFQAIRDGNSIAVKQYIKRYGVSVDVRDKDGRTPLMLAINYGNLSMVVFLLQQSADVNAQDNYERTPLIYAVDRGEYVIARELLSKGANPNVADKNLITPLMRAAQNGNEELIKLLISNGANSQMTDHLGRTVWDIMARAGARRTFIVQLMKQAEIELAHKEAAKSSEKS